MHNNSGDRAQWSSRLAFILAATGSTVGLGNVWKFPYVTGANGGGAFVLTYLMCVVLVGLPLLISKLLVGRRGRAAPGESFRRVAVAEGRSPQWRWVGGLGVLAAFLILCFYSVVGGWCVAYLAEALAGNVVDDDSAAVSGLFTSLLASPVQQVGWHTLFMLMTAAVVAQGITQGIERVINVLMPVLFLLLIALVIYATTTPGFGAAAEFLFAPDFSRLSLESVLVALGHAFFTLSLGMSVMVAYGSYLERDVPLPRTALQIALLDTGIALLAGLAIFSVVFSTEGLEPGQGPGLVFQTVPLAFSNMAGGPAIGVIFFALLLFAAWSSAISVLEPVVERLEGMIGRRRATWLIAAVCWLIGVLCALSFNVLSDWTLRGRGLFDLLDLLTTNLLLPLTGLGVAIFVGWRLTPATQREEVGRATTLWRWVVRYVTPLLVLAVFIFNLI